MSRSTTTKTNFKKLKTLALALTLTLAGVMGVSSGVGAASVTTNGVYIVPAIGSTNLDIDVDGVTGSVFFVLDTSDICQDAIISKMRVQWAQTGAPGSGRNDGGTGDMQGIYGNFFYDSVPSNTVPVSNNIHNPALISAPANGPEVFGLYWDPNGLNQTLDVEFNLSSFNRSQIDGLVAFVRYSYDPLIMETQGLDLSLLPATITMHVPIITFEYDDSACPSANTPPTAVNDVASTPSTTPIDVNVLTNDTDADSGDTLSISGTPVVTGGATTGTVSVAGGVITFTPASGFTGDAIITYTISDGNGGTDTATLTITVTNPSTSPLYCPSPYNNPQVMLSPSGDCDSDGITNQTEGYDPDADTNPSTGTPPVDTDSDGIPDYLDLDTDNDGILDSEEKGTASDSSTNPADTDKDGTPDFRDLDSDNDSTKDVLESGRNNLDTNNDGRIDGTTNTYGIASSAANPSDPKTLSTTSLQDSNNNGIADFRENPSTLAKTGTNLTLIITLAMIGLVSGLGLKRVKA